MEWMLRRYMKIWFLGSSDGLTLLGVKALIFIPEKSAHLFGLGVFSPNIQQGLLGIRHVSSAGWWSAWYYCMGQLFLGRGDVFDTCNATLTAAACHCQLLSIPASCNRTGRGLSVVIVWRTCLARSFCSTGHWAIQTSSGLGWPTSDLVGGLVDELEAC